MLAAANALSGDSELIAGTQLRVPEVGVSKNDASTFKPYNPNEIVGSTSPGLPYIPPPGSNNCASFAPILTSVILMIAMPYLAPIIQSSGSILAGALAVGGATFVANAAATAVGSALGFNTFSWRASLKEGAVAALSAGLGGSDVLSKLGPISKLISSSQFATIAAQTILNKGIDIVASKMTGVEHAPFSWKDIAIQSVTQAVTAPLVGKLTDKAFANIANPAAREFATKLTTGMITGAAGVAVSRAFGTKAEFNLGAIVGNSFASAMTPDLAALMSEESDQDEQLLIEDLETPEDWAAYMAENAPDIIDSSIQLAFNDPRTSITDKLARMHDWGTMWPRSQKVSFEGLEGINDDGIVCVAPDDWNQSLDNYNNVGLLSALHETSATTVVAASATVSTGKNDPGGVSYGAFQLSLNAGTLNKFISSDEFQDFKLNFDGIDPRKNASKFKEAWIKTAIDNGETFYRAQHNFIRRTHFDPVVAKVLAETGLDITNMPLPVQDVIWSMSVQHSAAPKLATQAARLTLNKYSTGVDNIKYSDSEAKQYINDLFDVRTNYLIGLSKSNRYTEGEKKTFISITKNRYPAERNDALKYLELYYSSGRKK